MKKITKIVLIITILLLSCITLTYGSEAPSLSEKNKSIVIAETYPIIINNLPKGSTVKYSSSKKSVAVVSKKGIVTGIKSGNAKINVRIKSEKKTINLILNITVKKPVISHKNVSLTPGETAKLKVLNKPKKGAKYIWRSSNKSVAIVSNGTVKAISPGNVDISVEVISNKASYTLKSRVEVEKIVLSKEKYALYEGESFDLEIINSKGTTWKSDDESVASVSQSGRVDAYSAGHCRIIARVNGNELACEVTVLPVGEVVKKSKYSQLEYRVSPLKTHGYNYREKAYSSSHVYRDILKKVYGKKAVAVYDAFAELYINLIYNNNLECGEIVNISGMEQFGVKFQVIDAAQLAVEMDMPLLVDLVSIGALCYYNGDNEDYKLTAMREFVNYFGDDKPKNKAEYNAMRDRIFNELDKYREFTSDVYNDEERLEMAAQMYHEGARYDTKAPYCSLYALLYKRGVCGSSASGFVLIGNAIDVPTYWLAVTKLDHAVNIVKPNSGKLKVIDVTFPSDPNNRALPWVMSISAWSGSKYVNWDSDAVFNFAQDSYFPNVDLLKVMGGLS